MTNRDNVIAMNNAQRKINSLNAVLKPLNIEASPGASLDGLPDLAAPTIEDLARAVLNAKGTPSQDKTVQALLAQQQLHASGLTNHLHAIAWIEAWDTAKARIPGLINEIRAQYAKVGGILTDAARGPLRGVQDLNLRALNGDIPTVHAAYAQAAQLHRAWRMLTILNGDRGQKANWSEFGEPRNVDQLWHAKNARPSQIPSADPWSLAAAGWDLNLPENLNAAAARRRDLIAAANAKDDDIRTLKMKGEHRAAERLANISTEQFDVPDELLS